MQYLTRIPTTSHAAREATFREQRAQARESLRTQHTVQSTLVRASHSLLDRNYLDAGRIVTMGKMIVRTSNTIRKLAPIAYKPDPPRYEPVTSEEIKNEIRTYAGIKANRILRVLAFLRRLKARQGELSVARRVRRMSVKLVNGLGIYTRVKALIADLVKAVEAPETAMIPRSNSKSKPSKERAPMPAFKWETSPHDIYGWTRRRMTKGYDPRQTSVYWLEKQAAALKRAVFYEHCGETKGRAPRTNQVRNSPQTPEIKSFIPPEGATSTDQIWPPIDLVRMIEEHRSCSAPTCGPGRRAGSGRVALEGLWRRSASLENLSGGQILDGKGHGSGTSQSEVLVRKKTNDSVQPATTSLSSVPSDLRISKKCSSHPANALAFSNYNQSTGLIIRSRDHLQSPRVAVEEKEFCTQSAKWLARSPPK